MKKLLILAVVAMLAGCINMVVGSVKDTSTALGGTVQCRMHGGVAAVDSEQQKVECNDGAAYELRYGSTDNMEGKTLAWVQLSS